MNIIKRLKVKEELLKDIKWELKREKMEKHRYEFWSKKVEEEPCVFNAWHQGFHANAHIVHSSEVRRLKCKYEHLNCD